MNRLTDARPIDLARLARADGEVFVTETTTQVSFRIERVFALAAPAGVKQAAMRIDHVHNS